MGLGIPKRDQEHYALVDQSRLTPRLHVRTDRLSHIIAQAREAYLREILRPGRNILGRPQHREQKGELPPIQQTGRRAMLPPFGHVPEGPRPSAPIPTRRPIHR